MFGAANLWAAQALAGGAAGKLQNARSRARGSGDFAQSSHSRDQEWRWWSSARAAVSAILTGSLVWALITWVKWRPMLHLEPWQDRILWVLILVGLAGFSVRTLALVLRLLGPSPPG
jgi:Na+/proline symporter